MGVHNFENRQRFRLDGSGTLVVDVGLLPFLARRDGSSSRIFGRPKSRVSVLLLVSLSTKPQKVITLKTKRRGEGFLGEEGVYELARRLATHTWASRSVSQGFSKWN